MLASFIVDQLAYFSALRDAVKAVVEQGRCGWRPREGRTDAKAAPRGSSDQAFGLDEGESIGALLSQGPPTPALAHLTIDKQGFAWLPEDDFVDHFAADVGPAKARVMGVPAWRSLPSWYLVADGDQAIPPDAERLFAKRMGATTVQVSTNHVAMVPTRMTC
jgi:hypothetical protein